MSESETRITCMSAHESATNLTNMVERDVSNAWQYRNNIQEYIRQTSNTVADNAELQLACKDYYGDLLLIATTFCDWFTDHGYVDDFNNLATEINKLTKRYDVAPNLKLYTANFSGEISFFAIDDDEAQSVIDQLEVDIEADLIQLDGYETSSFNFEAPLTD